MKKIERILLALAVVCGVFFIPTTALAQPAELECRGPHDSDYVPQDWVISLQELLRIIQFFNLLGYCPAQATEDGFYPSLCPDPGNIVGMPHSADINGDWVISLSELLRIIQLFNLGMYGLDCTNQSEDGYIAAGQVTVCPGCSAEGEGEGEGECLPPGYAPAILVNNSELRAAFAGYSPMDIVSPGYGVNASHTFSDTTEVIIQYWDVLAPVYCLSQRYPSTLTSGCQIISLPTTGYGCDTNGDGYGDGSVTLPPETEVVGMMVYLVFDGINLPVPINSGLISALQNGSPMPVTNGNYQLYFEGTPADTTKPVITLLGANPLSITQGDTFTDPGYTATDDSDGTNLTVTITGAVNTNVVGTYTLTYSVQDAAGNVAVPKTRTVTVTQAQDTTAPVITLIGGNVTMPQGTTFVEPGWTATDDRDGNLHNNVVVTGTVNTAIPGTYTLTYNVSDATGNAAVPKTRTVVVEVATLTCDGTTRGIAHVVRQANGDFILELDRNQTCNSNLFVGTDANTQIVAMGVIHFHISSPDPTVGTDGSLWSEPEVTNFTDFSHTMTVSDHHRDQDVRIQLWAVDSSGNTYWSNIGNWVMYVDDVITPTTGSAWQFPRN